MKKRMLAIMMSALMAAGVCSGVTVYADADSKTLNSWIRCGVSTFRIYG